LFPPKPRGRFRRRGAGAGAGTIAFSESSRPDGLGADERNGDVALVSPGSEPGLSRSISEPVRNVVGWALSLWRCVRGWGDEPRS
jgi:hypothetical protein